MSEILEFPHSIEQEIERMIEMERGICLLCGEFCTMRLGDGKPTLYLYCKACGFQAYIRKEQGILQYGSFLKAFLGEKSEAWLGGGGKDEHR